jgi:hypothetical protein
VDGNKPELGWRGIMYDKIPAIRIKIKNFRRYGFGGIFTRRGIPPLGVADSRVHRLREAITYLIRRVYSPQWEKYRTITGKEISIA